MIAVVGDVMLDRYWRCSQEQRKVNPERPMGFAYKASETFALGGAASVARLAKHLNGEVTLYGSIGRDREGGTIGKLCDEADVRHVLTESARRTTVKTRILVDGMLADDRYDLDGDGGWLALDGIETAHVIIVQDYRKGSVCRELIQQIKEINPDAILIVDPGLGVDPSVYRGASIIKANAREAAAWDQYLDLGGAIGVGATSPAVAEMLSCDVVVTRGDMGLLIYDRVWQVTKEIPAVKVDRVVDVCGAGDTIAAALAVKIAGNESLVNACEFAVACAAVQVQGIGCTPVDPVTKAEV